MFAWVMSRVSLYTYIEDSDSMYKSHHISVGKIARTMITKSKHDDENLMGI